MSPATYAVLDTQAGAEQEPVEGDGDGDEEGEEDGDGDGDGCVTGALFAKAPVLLLWPGSSPHARAGLVLHPGSTTGTSGFLASSISTRHSRICRGVVRGVSAAGSG